MAIEIISGNLNRLGNLGQYESDPSTWGEYHNGASLGQWLKFSRTAVAPYAGSYSELIENNVGDGGVTSDDTIGYIDYEGTGDLMLPFGAGGDLRATSVNAMIAGHKYVAKARVKVLGYLDALVRTDVIKFRIYGTGASAPAIALVYEVTHTVGDIFDDGGWLEIEARWTAESTNVHLVLISSMKSVANTSSDYPMPLGVDKFEIFEYIDVVDPCTLAIDTTGTVVTDESAPGANDGSITVAITGGTGPFEYSKDGGATWQSSNLFAGLADGVYSIVVREVARITCNSAQSFSVNEPGLTFDFTATKIDESVAGANNGRIEVTVTGTGGPFTFSKDGGTTYQSSNIFTGLAPGTYTIVVKDAAGATLSRNVTILAGAAVFEKAWFSRNPITFPKGASTGWGALTNYRLYDDVRVEDVAGSSAFNSKLKVSLYPDVAGNVTFQIRQAVRGSLNAAAPAWNENTIVRLTDRIKLFKHFTGHMQDLDTVPATLTGSNPHLVILGGLSKLKWASTDFFGTLMLHRKMFMTWAPVEKQVDRNQEDYLNYFVMNLLTTQLKLQVKAYFDDGTDSTSITAVKSGVAYGQLYQIPAGPTNCGALLIDATKTVTKYQLGILDQDNTLISEVRTYRIDLVSHPRKRLFMFLNSLGSFEVLRFTGVTENTTDIAKENVVKFLPYNYGSTDGEKEVYGARLQERSSFSSGYLDDKRAAQWLEYLKDFLLSRKVYEVTPEGDRIPIVVSAGSFPTGADQDYTRFIRFTALQSYEDENYTPRDVDPESDDIFDDTFDDSFA